MQLVWTRRLLAAVLVAAGVGVTAAPPAADAPVKASIPDAKKQEDGDLAFIKASIEKGVADAKKARGSLEPVRSTAILIAQNAQNRMGPKDDALAGLRDQMIKISDALQDDDDHKADWAAAQKAFDGIKDAKGKTEPVKLHDAKEFTLATLMDVFKKTKSGGRGWEEALTEQAMKATDADLALQIAQGSYLVGQLTDHLPAEKAETGNAAKKKQWATLSEGMRTLSLEVAGEAGKGKKADMDVLTKKLTALEGNCKACHTAFK